MFPSKTKPYKCRSFKICFFSQRNRVFLSTSVTHKIYEDVNVRRKNLSQSKLFGGCPSKGMHNRTNAYSHIVHRHLVTRNNKYISHDKKSTRDIITLNLLTWILHWCLNAYVIYENIIKIFFQEYMCNPQGQFFILFYF